MAENHYAAIAGRIEDDTFDRRADMGDLLALLGYETTVDHGRLGVACRKIGESHWQSAPRIDSADDAALWIKPWGGRWNDLDQIEPGGDRFAAGIEHDDFGNDYGEARGLGPAMWAAFVRLAGKVDRNG